MKQIFKQLNEAGFVLYVAIGAIIALFLMLASAAWDICSTNLRMHSPLLKYILRKLEAAYQFASRVK